MVTAQETSPTDEYVGTVQQEPLSSREAEIMELIGQGLSNAEIAQRLYLSVNTIKTHIRGAYRKLGLARRVEAVLWANHHHDAKGAQRAG